MNEMILIDSGVIEPLSIESIKILKPDFIIASSIAFERDSEKYQEINSAGLAGEDLASKFLPTNKKKDVKNYIKDRQKEIKKKGIEKRHGIHGLSAQSILDTSFSIMHNEMSKIS